MKSHYVTDLKPRNMRLNATEVVLRRLLTSKLWHVLELHQRQGGRRLDDQPYLQRLGW